MDCSLPGSSAHGIFQARALEWSAIAFSEELYKKDLHDPDNHNGVISHLEPDILDCEVKWALGSITPNVLNTFIFELSNDGKGHGETITDQKPEQVPLVVELWYLFLAEDNTCIIHTHMCCAVLSCSVVSNSL